MAKKVKKLNPEESAPAKITGWVGGGGDPLDFLIDPSQQIAVKKTKSPKPFWQPKPICKTKKAKQLEAKKKLQAEVKKQAALNKERDKAYKAKRVWDAYLKKLSLEEAKKGKKEFTIHVDGFVQARLRHDPYHPKDYIEYCAISLTEVPCPPNHKFTPGEHIGGTFTFRHTDADYKKARKDDRDSSPF